MTLKELQQMIKEEFTAYTNEAEDEVDVSVSDADVDMDAEMGDDMEAEETDEDILRNIYDMLKTKFEAEGEGEMGDEEMPMDDVEGGDEDSDLDELSNHGMGKSAKNSSGPNSGYTNAKTNPLKGQGSVNPLQERFQKLANIIK